MPTYRETTVFPHGDFDASLAGVDTMLVSAMVDHLTRSLAQVPEADRAQTYVTGVGAHTVLYRHYFSRLEAQADALTTAAASLRRVDDAGAGMSASDVRALRALLDAAASRVNG